MTAFRLLLARRHLAALICAATLLLKLLVPTGYMIDSDHGQLRITICSGVMTTPMPAMAGMHGEMPDHGKRGDHGKAEMPCAFSGLSAAVTAATDPIQLGALIAFVMAVAFVGVALPIISRAPRLRPPLRAPPAFG